MGAVPARSVPSESFRPATRHVRLLPFGISPPTSGPTSIRPRELPLRPEPGGTQQLGVHQCAESCPSQFMARCNRAPLGCDGLKAKGYLILQTRAQVRAWACPTLRRIRTHLGVGVSACPRLEFATPWLHCLVQPNSLSLEPSPLRNRSGLRKSPAPCQVGVRPCDVLGLRGWSLPMKGSPRRVPDRGAPHGWAGCSGRRLS